MTPARLRLLATALTVALAGSAAALTVVPLGLQSLGHHERMAEAEAALARWRAVAANRPAAEAELRALRQQAAMFPGLFQGQTASIASANMQAELKRRIEAPGGEIRSMQPGTANQEGPLERMEIKVDFTCPTYALPEILANVENAQPFLIPRQMNIGAAEFQLASQTQQAAKLSHQWTVRGYRWAGGQ